MKRDGRRTIAGDARWTLRLRGDPALISPEGAEHLLERRAAALLALVAVEPGVTRRRVAALLWPDSAESNARQALRQQLLRLRRLCGSELLTGGDALRLDHEVRSDAADAASGGRLLGSLDFADSEELARWVESANERLQHDSARRIQDALAQAEARGDLGAALGEAQRMLAIDATSEHAHRTLMRLHYLRGDVMRARAAYERLREMLAQEFDAEPSAQTEQLARTVRAALPVSPAVRSGTPPSVLRPPRLIGREREWQALGSCWDEAAGAIVTGVAGMGKTRLVTDFAATRDDILVVVARPGDEVAAYAVLARLVRALVARARPTLPAHLAAELAHLLPELGAAEPIRDESDRMRLLRAVEALLDAEERSGKLAGIVIDDLHFADAASVESLRILAGRALRLLLTGRGDEFGEAARALIDSLVSAGAGRMIELSALTPQQVSELIESLELEGIDGTTLGERIARHTGGNPLFVLETLKAMILEGGGASGEARIPVASNVTALVARRLAKLSAGAVRIARVAAVAGQDFSAELAAHVLGVRPLDLADAWGELDGAHVLRDGAFEHDLIHEAALSTVPAAIGRRLHAEIAAFLEAGGTEPARVANHWAAADRPGEAGAAFERAAVRARDAGRRIEEARLLEQAAGQFARCGDHRARFEALLGRAEAMICNDLGEAALAATREAEACARDDHQKLRALLARAEYLSQRSDSEAAVSVGQAGIGLARKADRADLALLFVVVVSGGLCELRRVDEALALLEPARTAAEALPPRARAEYLVALGIALDLSNRLSEALAVFEAAREVATAGGLKDLLATTLSNLATTTSKRGEIARAVEFGRLGLQLWRESEPLKGPPMQTQTLLAHRLRDLGRYDEAIGMLEDALEEFRHAGVRHWVFAAAHRLALAYAQVGQHARAQRLLADEPEDLATKVQAIWHAHRAEAARLAGGAPLKPIRLALSLLGGDLDDGNNRLVSLFAAPMVPPEEGESIATSVAAWAAARERFGMAIAAHVRAAGCALALGAIDRARPQMEAALRLFADYSPDNFYRAEVWWVGYEVFRAANCGELADRLLAEGRDWVAATAAKHVRPEFRDSFLHRNPVNRALLSAAHRLPPASRKS